MVMLCGLWSMAGVVSRQIESAHSIEVTFWRSAFCFLMLVVWTSIYTRNHPFRQMMAMGWAGVLSGLFWCIMFTCFMVALMMTTVANTLLTIGLSPLIAAILARLILGMYIPRVTWLCIVIAAIGMWWMFRQGLSGDGLVGVLIALFERAVGLYASLIHINAYHQPGVEAGKKAAATVLGLQRKIVAHLASNSGKAYSAEALASALGDADAAEMVFKICTRLSANGRGARIASGTGLKATFQAP